MRALILGAAFLGLPTLACDVAARDSSRVAIAGGSLTEIVYLFGAEDRIIAADRTSNFPAAALELPSVGYVRNLSAEGLLSLSPTLVLGEHDMGPPEVLDQIARTGVDVVTVPEVHTIDGILDKARCVARVLDIDEETVRRVERDLAPTLVQLAQVRMAAPDEKPRVGVLLGIRDGQPLAAGRETSGHGLIQMAGGTNVFGEMQGWKPGSMESMIRFNPDVLVIPERGVQAEGGIDGIVAHPSIRLTNAGREKRIVTMDGMTMLGFGPRTLEAAVDLARELGTLPADTSLDQASAQSR